MSKKITVSWPAKLAIMDHYNASDARLCEVFEVTQDELDTARSLRTAGTLAADRSFDVTKYAPMFAGTEASAPVSTNSTQTVHKGGNMSSKTTTATVHAKPETATKKAKVPAKRGRKGDKISTALQAVPLTPVPVDSFINQHGISLAVLRQSKRFISKLDAETQAAIGHVNVRQDKNTKQLMIWRETGVAQ